MVDIEGIIKKWIVEPPVDEIGAPDWFADYKDKLPKMIASEIRREILAEYFPKDRLLTDDEIGELLKSYSGINLFAARDIIAAAVQRYLKGGEK